MAESDVNLIPNPGFESGKEAWDLFVPSAHRGTFSEFIISNDDPHSGAACAEMRTDQPIRFALSSKKYPVVPKERYRVRAWVRFSKDAEFDSGTPGAYIRATLEKSKGVDIEDPKGHIVVGLGGKVGRNSSIKRLAPEELPKGWNKIEAVFEIPDGASLMGFSLFVHGVIGQVSWDDILLERVGIAVPLSPTVDSQ